MYGCSKADVLALLFVVCCAVAHADLALYPSEKWKDKGWDFIDSLDPTREWGGFSYMDMPDPAKGQEVSHQ